MKLFEPFQTEKFELKNHLVMPPMCMYQCKKQDGIPTDFHISHYGARAIGQVGMIIVEATGVQPNGRITDDCLGLWDDKQVDGHHKITEAIKNNGSFAAIQLNHAGRKSETKALRHVGPSAIPFNDQPLNYDELTCTEIQEVIASFQEAAKRADQAGYDGIEIHAAHGYLIHQFISPLSNTREDDYGKDRFLLLKEIMDAIKEVWPKEKGLWMRISATDYHEEGLSVEDWVQFLQENPNIVDFVHVSAGAIMTVPIHAYPGYMLELSKTIRENTGYQTIGVGLIQSAEMASFALESEQCDLVAIGRGLLRNPNLYLQFLNERGEKVPEYYERAFR